MQDHAVGGGGAQGGEQRRQTKHTAPALSQVLYFPEVMAKRGWWGWGEEDRKSQREQGGGRRGDSKPLFYKSQEASAQGKKESWRIVRGCGKHLDFLLCRSPWGGKAAAAAAALNSYVHRRESQAVGRRGKGVISPGAEFYHHRHTDGLCTFSPLPCTWPTRHLYLLIPVGGGHIGVARGYRGGRELGSGLS